MLNSSVLVLNRSYLPIHVTSVRRAFCLIYQGGARAVNERYETFDFESWKSQHRLANGPVNRPVNGRLNGEVHGEEVHGRERKGGVLGEATMSIEVIGTSDGAIPVPRVIVLTHFDRVPRRQVRFSRTHIFRRDRYTCQYCELTPPRSQLNLDHVVPRAQGGLTTWENVVCSCVPCNRKKGGRTPEQAGVRLRRRPRRPRWTPLMSVVPHGARYREWVPFLGESELA
jgi:5-methylcytosine-specific restriction endonuclease McrA